MITVIYSKHSRSGYVYLSLKKELTKLFVYLFPSAAHKYKVNSLNKVRKKQTLEVLYEKFLKIKFSTWIILTIKNSKDCQLGKHLLKNSWHNHQWILKLVDILLASISSDWLKKHMVTFVSLIINSELWLQHKYRVALYSNI